MSQDFINLIAQGGAPVIVFCLLIFIAGAGDEPKWLYGNYHRRAMDDAAKELQNERNERKAEGDLLRIERDHYRDLLFNTLPLLDKAITTVENRVGK